MSEPSSPRRVTVVTPHTRADVALPVGATVAEVVEELTRLVRIDDDDPMGWSGGWLLSRLGREPFDEEQLVATSGIRDGDFLYLTSRRSRLPPVVFDDVIDAIASAAAGRPDRWGPTNTRRAALAVAAACTAGGAAGLLAGGPPWTVLVAIGAAVTLLLLVSTAGVARALGEATLATGVACAAVVFAGVTGVLALAGDRPLTDLEAPHLLVGCAAVLCCALLAMLAIGRVVPAFVGIALAALIGVGATTWESLSAQPTERVAALTAVLVLVTQPLLSMAALRMGRLPFPRLPVDEPDFRRTRAPSLDSDVLEQTRRADEALNALTIAVHVVLAVTIGLLIVAPGRWAPLLGVALALVVLIRARHPQVVTQRAAMLVTGAAGVAFAIAAWLRDESAVAHGSVALAAVGLAAGWVAYARKAPGQSRSPYWGRVLDIAEFIAVVSVVPLLLAVFDLYSKVRGLAA